MKQIISGFRGPHYFLSNFYERPIWYRNVLCANSEVAFHLQKCSNMQIWLELLEQLTKTTGVKKDFSNLTASEAKRLGRKVPLRADWETIKFDEMYHICYAKFTQHKDLQEKLLATGSVYLEEANQWGDRVWGTVNGNGRNHLGKILMKVREEIRLEQTKTQ